MKTTILNTCLAACLAASVLCSASTAPAADKPASAEASKSDGKKASPNGPPSLKATGWQKMFNGKTLAGWKDAKYAGAGEIRVENTNLVLEMGVMTGVTYTNPIPRINYEVSLEAMRDEGSDFFCALTFPVNDDPCTLVVGGWGGGVVGLSSLDGMDASSNETTTYVSFKNKQWYHIRLRVIPGKIQAWIDEDKVVDVVTTGRKISIRTEVEQSVPFGIATWSTTGVLRNIQMRPL